MNRGLIGLCFILLFSSVSGSPVYSDPIDRVRQEIYAWRDAWEARDIDRYLSFYHPAFRSGKLDYQAWKKKKSELFGYPGSVSIDIYGLSVFREKGHAAVRFVQRYKSRQLSDVGEKNLVLEKIGNRWKIISEEWRPLSPGTRVPAALPVQRQPLRLPPDSVPTPQKLPEMGVWEGIKFQIIPDGGEKVFIRVNGFFIPEVFSIEGERPRVVIDISNISQWGTDSEIPVHGKLIRRIRSFLHREQRKLRIVLDLEHSENYNISQTYYSEENIYCLDVRP